jgi:cytochrome c peroxidase
MGARRVAGQSGAAAARSVERYCRYADGRAAGPGVLLRPGVLGPATQDDAINRPSPPARDARRQPLGISCATCHDLRRAGVDTTSMPGHVSVGAGWTDVNALAVVNSAYRPVVFWNGRADSLWALNVVVAESATTLNGNRLRTAHQIADRYAEPYNRVFADDFGPLDIGAITRSHPAATVSRPRSAVLAAMASHFSGGWNYELSDPKAMVNRILVNWAKAIAAYEYKLISRESDFDLYVQQGPDSSAIPAAAKRGARLFVGKAGCIDCHSGTAAHRREFPQRGRAPERTDGAPLEDCPASKDPGTRRATASRTQPEMRALGRVRWAPTPARHGLDLTDLQPLASHQRLERRPHR